MKYNIVSWISDLTVKQKNKLSQVNNQAHNMGINNIQSRTVWSFMEKNKRQLQYLKIIISPFTLPDSNVSGLCHVWLLENLLHEEPEALTPLKWTRETPWRRKLHSATQTFSHTKTDRWEGENNIVQGPLSPIIFKLANLEWC